MGERWGRLQQQLGNKAGVVGFTGSTGKGERIMLPQPTTVDPSLRRCVCVCERTCEAFVPLLLLSIIIQ